jgi:toxin CcdB
MARFDVYVNPDSTERRHTPYLLDLQNDYLKGVHSRIVVPLHHALEFQYRADHLHQVFDVAGSLLVMDITQLSSIPASALKKQVVNLAAEQYKIQDAIDTVFGAY